MIRELGFSSTRFARPRHGESIEQPASSTSGNAPIIGSVSQTAGKNTGGDTITVTGAFFTVGMASALGAITLDGVTPTTKLTILTNAHAPGVISWTLTNGFGSAAPQAFTYLVDPPVVSAIVPNHGPSTLTNTARTITCSGLPAPGSGVTIAATVGGGACTNIVNNGNGTITCDVPAHAAGLATVIVTVDGVSSTGGSNLYTFDPAPTLTSFTYVTKVGGVSFGIGTGMLQGLTNLTVNIGPGTLTPLTNVTVTNNGTQVSATLPTPGPYAAGNWDVTVDVEGMTFTLAGGFTIFAPPTIAGLMYDIDPSLGTTVVGGFVTALTEQSSNAYAFAPVNANTIAFTANAVNGRPAMSGNGSTGLLLSTTNIAQATKAVTAFVILKMDPSTANATVLFEQTNNSKSSAGVNGYRVEYLTAGPQLDVSSGTSSGASLNETYAITGVALNNGYQALCFVFNRSAVYPVTIIAGIPVYESTYVGGALVGQDYITAGSSASNYDTAPLSLFARNVGGAASAASKMSLARMFAYNSALSQSVIQNVLTAIASEYATETTPATAQLFVPGDSLFSVFDTAASLTAPTFIYTTQYYDNLQLMISAVSGWTLSNIDANKAAIFAPRRPDVPVYLLALAGTNDLAANDTLMPGTLFNTFLSVQDYVAGLASPAFAGMAWLPLFPRGVVSAGTPASFEARRSGRDMTNAALPGRQASHAYTATTDYFLVVDGSGHNQLFRCTTTGVSAAGGGPAYNFTLGATTTDGTAVMTCYGRPFNDAIADATNQATHHYTCITALVGGPLDNPANTSVLTYYVADKIHIQPVQQTGQANPTNPTGPPAAGSVLWALAPFLDQGGTFPRAYLPPNIVAVTPSSGSAGTPLTLTMTDAGLPAGAHSVTINGLDCPNVSRVSDIKVTCNAPSGLTPGVYGVTYRRTDGQVVTLPNAFTCVQSAVTSVQVVRGTAAAPVALLGAVAQLAATTHNAFVVKVGFNSGASIVTGLALNGTALSSVTVIDDRTVTGVLASGTRAVATGDVTATAPSNPTALVNGWSFVASINPGTIMAAGEIRGWGDDSSIQHSGASCTAWNDNAGLGVNLGVSTTAPAYNATSAVFTRNGVGIPSAGPLVNTGSSATNTSFSKSGVTRDTSTGTPVCLWLVANLTTNATNQQTLIQWQGTNFTFPSLETNSVEKPFMWNYTGHPPEALWPTAMNDGAGHLIYGYDNGNGAANAAVTGMSLDNGAESVATGSQWQTASSTTTGTIRIGASTFSATIEACAWALTNTIPTGTKAALMWIWAHDLANVS